MKHYIVLFLTSCCMLISSSFLSGAANDVISILPETPVSVPVKLKSSPDFKILCSDSGVVLFWMHPDTLHYNFAVGSTNPADKSFSFGNCTDSQDIGSICSLALTPDGNSLLQVHVPNNSTDDIAMYYREGSIDYLNKRIVWNTSPRSTLNNVDGSVLEGGFLHFSITGDSKFDLLYNSAYNNNKIWRGFSPFKDYKDDPDEWTMEYQDYSNLNCYPFDSAFVKYNEDYYNSVISSINSNSLYIQVAGPDGETYASNTFLTVKTEKYDLLNNPILTHRILCPYTGGNSFPILAFYKNVGNESIYYTDGYFNNSNISMSISQSLISGLSGDAIDYFEVYASSDYTKIFLTCYDTTKNELLADIGTINNYSGAPSKVSWLETPVVIGNGPDYQNYKSSVSRDFSRFAVTYRDSQQEYHVLLGTINAN